VILVLNLLNDKKDPKISGKSSYFSTAVVFLILNTLIQVPSKKVALKSSANNLINYENCKMMFYSSIIVSLPT
jgi:hypothetical protein